VPKSVYTTAYRQLTKMLGDARTEAGVTQAERSKGSGLFDESRRIKEA
jgi:hypothetical protein